MSGPLSSLRAQKRASMPLGVPLRMPKEQPVHAGGDHDGSLGDDAVAVGAAAAGAAAGNGQRVSVGMMATGGDDEKPFQR